MPSLLIRVQRTYVGVLRDLVLPWIVRRLRESLSTDPHKSLNSWHTHVFLSKPLHSIVLKE